MAAADLRANILKVLDVLRGSAMDGYRLMNRTGLGAAELVAVMQDSSVMSIVSVEGSLTADAIGEAYFWIPPGNRGGVEQLFRSFSFLR